MNNYILAETITQDICLFFSDEESKRNVKTKHLWDYYPGLFDDLKERYLEEKEIDEFEQFKLTRKQFARFHNKKYKGDGDM